MSSYVKGLEEFSPKPLIFFVGLNIDGDHSAVSFKRLEASDSSEFK